MFRFFVPPEWLGEDPIAITGALAHRLRNVLRLRSGEHIILLDNSGWSYETELVSVDAERVVGRVVRKSLAAGEPRTKVTLYQATLKGRNFELVLQKGTELGLVEFVPLICQRCVMSTLDTVGTEKTKRWQRIIAEAAEQSRRGRLPQLQPVTLFPQACEMARRADLSIVPWEEERDLSLRQLLRPEDNGTARSRPFSINIFVGPEGGLTAEEIHRAKRFGIIPVTLGPRILRAETAGLVAATAILYELGDLG
jgi:16S rRNA (uracil1498-N3)-methyltransferase